MPQSRLEQNILVHNKIAKKYERIHGEIYNDIEQSRLKESLHRAISKIRTESRPYTALDFGCGAGNLTTHLTKLGCEVIAADVSSGFLDLVASRTYPQKVRTHVLNGIDLAGIENESMDMVAMYSVLHHVPDYLSLMKEFARVLKKGGVVYIDHEASDQMWKEGDLSLFEREMRKKSSVDWKKYFVVSNYIDRFIRIFIDPTYQREGDIHVFKDDHIEWSLIRDSLLEQGVHAVEEQDYLLYHRSYDQKTYEAWKNKVGDMHVFIGVKA